MNLHVQRRRGGSRLRHDSGRRLHVQPGHAGADRRGVRGRNDRHLRRRACRHELHRGRRPIFWPWGRPVRQRPLDVIGNGTPSTRIRRLRSMGHMLLNFDTRLQSGRQLTIAMSIRPLVFVIGLIRPRMWARESRASAAPATRSAVGRLESAAAEPTGDVISRPRRSKAVPTFPRRPTGAGACQRRPPGWSSAISGRLTARPAVSRQQARTESHRGLYRLPAGLGEPPDLSRREASVPNVTGLRDSTRQVSCGAMGRCSCAGVVGRSEPVTALLGGGLRLVQRPVRGGREAGYVTVDAYDGIGCMARSRLQNRQDPNPPQASSNRSWKPVASRPGTP